MSTSAKLIFRSQVLDEAGIHPVDLAADYEEKIFPIRCHKGIEAAGALDDLAEIPARSPRPVLFPVADTELSRFLTPGKKKIASVGGNKGGIVALLRFSITILKDRILPGLHLYLNGQEGKTLFDDFDRKPAEAIYS